MMDLADAEEYTQALGQVVAGGWRQVALGERLGVPKALGMSTEDWVQGRLGGYVRLSIPERRDAVAELVEQGMSNVAVAEVLGVDEITVRRDREASTNVGALIEPLPEPLALVAEDSTNVEAVVAPSVDVLAEHDVLLRRSKAKKMLTKAQAATGDLSPSVAVVAEAVVAGGPDELAAERERIGRSLGVWNRLLAELDTLANQKVRRVK